MPTELSRAFYGFGFSAPGAWRKVCRERNRGGLGKVFLVGSGCVQCSCRQQAAEVWTALLCFDFGLGAYTTQQAPSENGISMRAKGGNKRGHRLQDSRS